MRIVCVVLAAMLGTPVIAAAVDVAPVVPEAAAAARPGQDLADTIRLLTAGRDEMTREDVMRVAEAAVRHAAAAKSGEPSGRALAGPEQQLLNLRTAAALLDVADREGEDPLAKGVALAKLASLWQLATIGAEPAPPADVGAVGVPSEALFALLEWQSVAPTPEQELEIRALDGLEEPLGGALAAFVVTFQRFDEATRAAYAGEGTVTPEGIAFVIAARSDLLDATLALRDALDTTPPATTTSTCSPVAVAPTFSIDLLDCDNEYTTDYQLLIDAGGDDTYLNNAGGSGVGGGCTPSDSAAALVDFNGEDRYGDPTGLRSCGVNGGGYGGGAGFLIDAGFGEANSFFGKDAGVNGGAMTGLGFLLTASEAISVTNTYEAVSFGVNGGGSAYVNDGFGMLLDIGSTTRYIARDGGANGGGYGTLNAGFLVDVGGDDEYGTPGNPAYSGYGLNGGAYGGIGFLIDVAGSDKYGLSDVDSEAVNGGASEAGIGFLYDAGVDDDRYYAQGGQGGNGGSLGTSSGMLIDEYGHEEYVAGSMGTNGGSDFSYFALLLDGGGNDVYETDGRGGNGGARGYAENEQLAALVDLGVGDDTYHAKWEGPSNGAGMTTGIGILFDSGGTDTYQEDYTSPCDGSGMDKTIVPKCETGAQIDVSTTALQDADADGVPDILEPLICGRPIVRQTINDQSPTAGECLDSMDYVPPVVEYTFFVPTFVAPGDDDDLDGVPKNFVLTGLYVTINPFAPNPVTTTPGTEYSEDVDPNDNDANDPVPYWVTGEVTDLLDTYDADRDGVPDDVESTLCGIQDDNEPMDGSCSTPDDYEPWEEVPNPRDVA